MKSLRLQRWKIEDGDDHVTAHDDRGPWVEAIAVGLLEERFALVEELLSGLREDLHVQANGSPSSTVVHIDDRLCEILDVVHDWLTVPQRREIEEKVSKQGRR